MKGNYVVIGKEGEKYYYRYLTCAFNKYWSIYGASGSLEHLETHLISA